jgi:AMP-polyphosphate phosphotransferase
MKILDSLDLSKRLDKDEYNDRLETNQRRLLQLRLAIGGHLDGPLGPGLLIICEGPDASGKGGAIRSIVEHLDPRHYSVYSYSAPSPREKRHHFLWRFQRDTPGMGGMCVFDRSWYGRVLVERIEGYASRAEWTRAYETINDFESSLVTEGVILVKFYLHTSEEEQLRRFNDRANDPLKRWKLTDEDWRNREKAPLYRAAAEDMFAKTSHKLAPWDVIAAEQKRYARVSVLETLNKRIEQGMKRAGYDIPDESDLDDDGAA